MVSEYPSTTYFDGAARKEQERRMVQEGTALWARRKEELQRQKHREQRELREMLARYSPWGKPGGGAPCASSLRKKNVPLDPQEPRRNYSFSQDRTDRSDAARPRAGDPDPLVDVDTNKLYHGKSTQGAAMDPYPTAASMRDPRARYNEEIQMYKLTGGGGLTPLFTGRRYRIRHQTHRHLATDVTQPGYTLEALRALGSANKEHIAELAEQIRRKRQSILEEQRRERESCREHFETWRRLWGRPGHGAPMDHARRSNLYDILYRPVVY